MSKEFIGSLELNRIYQQDCLEGMKFIPDGSIDMILCDLPYGTTQNKWDSIIPLNSMWEQYERIIKNDGAIVLTSAQPFTSQLIQSNLKLFRYEIVWDKVNRFTGFMNAKKMPLKKHENICVFYKKLPTYNPQMEKGEPYKTKRKGIQLDTGENYGKVGIKERTDTLNEGTRYPSSILSIKSDSKTEMGLHPTQKPLALFEYLIKTYTNEGDIVLDNCMGSGTTAVVCKKLKRKFIGFETESKYIEIANLRLESEFNEIDDQKILDK